VRVSERKQENWKREEKPAKQKANWVQTYLVRYLIPFNLCYLSWGVWFFHPIFMRKIWGKCKVTWKIGNKHGTIKNRVN
jgi:hypothetical protein